MVWQGRWDANASGYHCIMTSPDEADVAPATGFTTSPLFETLGSSGMGLAYQRMVVSNTSGQVGIRCDAASPGLYAVSTGWLDPRRN